eukprot:199306-Pyramimonas_sp.AAC.1
MEWQVCRACRERRNEWQSVRVICRRARIWAPLPGRCPVVPVGHVQSEQPTSSQTWPADCLCPSWSGAGAAVGELAGLPGAWPWRGVPKGVDALMAAA